MREKSILKRSWMRGTAFVAATAFSLALAAPANAAPLAGVTKAEAEKNVVTVTFEGGMQGKITMLEDGIFRYNVDPTGEFGPYAKPKNEAHTAKIQAQPDTSTKYTRPNASVKDEGAKFVISVENGTTTIEFDKDTAKMTVKTGGRVVMEEAAPLDVDSTTVQKLVKHDGENFFGGGTQNGRFIHTGNSIHIANESNWVDGGVASPNPFYWSSSGYGVLRNTFADGIYDFGSTEANTTATSHSEKELDAYYFVADAQKGVSTAPVAQELLQAYFKVTGNPVLLPEYAFYVGHLNAWNRDAWSNEGSGNGWRIKGGESAADPNAGSVQYETNLQDKPMPANATIESLNGEAPTVSTDQLPAGVSFPREFSAQARLDNYQDNDMPLGYFLPNDGYGAGYGQNGYGKTGGVNEKGESSPERLAAVAANVQNLKKFTDYANSKGVATGLWTQSYLVPDANPATQWQRLRDFRQEVKTGGVTTLKTDVAWVGPGYSMALDGTKTAYDIVTEEANHRPNIITLDGWAGTQRFGGIWTGDQTGGNWEYIRFHVPTFIGQSLSGNPNIGSDNDGIFGGAPIIATRDYQWKSFAPLMLDMDGWGSYVKAPQTHGDPYTGITRMYLKLKSQLMPYIYTTAASAANIDTGNKDTGLPFVRAILLTDDTFMANSTATQYEYTMGEDFLVAPIYQNTADAENDGSDVRNGIYLPGDPKKDVWIDYFTGKQYRAGQVLNNFDAPLWKLPLFVKANAIVPMYEPNNNPDDVDRSIRNVEFFAVDGKNEYSLFEDTGTYVENKVDESNKEYGREGNISYGEHVKTVFTSEASAKDKTATFTAGKSEGTYDGYNADRTTTFIVNVSKEPESVVAKNGDQELKVDKVDSKEAFDKATPEAGKAVYFYDTKPNLNYNATADSEEVRKEGFSQEEVITTPKLYVKFAKTNVNNAAQTLQIKGFENDGALPGNEVIDGLAAPQLKAPEDALAPTSVKLTWNKIDGAIGYDILIDGVENAIPSGDTTEFTVADLGYKSTHKFKIRTRTAKGVSKWSDEITATTLDDPWRNCPKPANVQWDGGEQWGKLDLAFDHDDKNSNHFHSTGNVIDMPMTIDYGSVYSLDLFVYTPRQDNGGNGNVAKMKIETSVDGVHWKDHGITEWDNKGEGKLKSKTVDLKGNTARYLRLTVKESAGGFFSATELALYKGDKSVVHELGSLKNPGTVGEEDYNHLPNCIGRENHGTGVTDWNSHVAASSADFNMNNAYDVYDLSFTMSKLDGGTKKTGKVTGSVAVVADEASVKAGETVTVAVKAQGAKNVNAMGALVHYPSADFEFVNNSLKYTQNAAEMENRSGNYTFGDEIDSVNISLANKGDKALYGGTEDIAVFQLKAKKDCEVKLDSEAWLIGPQQDFVSSKGSELGPEVKELGQDAFDITMTNDVLTTDDGTNVQKLIQSSNYDGLFDNKENDNGFEFKWDLESNHQDGRLPEYVKLPTTMTFTLKESRVLRDVEVLNRESSNGAVNSLEAVITYEDGSRSEFKGGEFAEHQDVYTLTAEKGKKVKSIEIKPLTSNGTVKGYEGEEAKNRMLTLREINFNYVEGDEPEAPEEQELGQDAFNLTITNKHLPKDEKGENVKELVQQGAYDGLFDNNETGRDFELKWFQGADTFDERVELPVTLGFALKASRPLSAVELVNGGAGSNGSIKSIEAVITFEDGSKQEFKGGDFDTPQERYLFKVEDANKSKNVAKVEITPLTTTGKAEGLAQPLNRMLTILETNFKYTDGEKPEPPQVDKSALQELVNGVAGLKQEDYTPETWAPFAEALAGANTVLKNDAATQEDVNAAVDALAAARDSLKPAEGEKPEPPQVDKSALQELVNGVAGLKQEDYTPETWAPFAEALAGANTVLGDANATQEQVDAARAALDGAYKALKKADNGGGGTGNGGNTGNGTGNGTGSGGNTGSGTGNGDNTKPSKPGSGLPQTGDVAAVAVAATGGIGGLFAALGAKLRRRRND